MELFLSLFMELFLSLFRKEELFLVAPPTGAWIETLIFSVSPVAPAGLPPAVFIFTLTHGFGTVSAEILQHPFFQTDTAART
jgi:hypothetical protein